MRFKEMRNMINFKEEVKKLPDVPGVYIMKDEHGEIIYIGKAKNLKNRVSSYFMNDSGHTEKVKKMVSNISAFDYIMTDSEFEALVLECSLIKKHQPKYNILLKDDKGFSYIKITKEKWPKILYVKQKQNDSATYIGPYTNSFSVKQTAEEMIKIFKVPTCNRNLDRIYKRPCLNYYIKRCSAPCIRAISNEDYVNSIKEAENFVKRGSSETIKSLRNTMQQAAENLNFEYAAQIRDRIKAIENVKNRQKVVAYKVKNQDVIACAYDEKNISFEVFRFKDGDLYDSQNYIVEPEDSLPATRSEFLEQYYEKTDSIPKTILIDGEIENEELIKKYFSEHFKKNVNIIIPKRGEQLHLLEMCAKNAEESLLRNKGNKSKIDDTLEELRNILNLKSVPNFIEAYDISNIMGKDNVGGMVVYKNGKPLKSAYRKFKIKFVDGQDDYGSMREVISRRIQEYLNNKENSNNSFGVLPDLMLIDGGIAHTRAASEVLREFGINIPIFGMVKDSKHRTRAMTTDGEEIEIKNYGRLFNFITNIQDEVHRYTINYHKKLRNKRVVGSSLIRIKGVGHERAKMLLNKYGSLKNIAKASVEDLKLMHGMPESVAKEIHEYFEK
ncbi:MAG: excinuclease ABC subunit UvrC [Clostridia bacterium]|nr:excinuclease ABC subunit UvrC [Clostridia bacterium]